MNSTPILHSRARSTAWTASGVPAAVSPATLSGLPRVVAVNAASAVDVAAPPAVFGPHPPVAARVSRVPAPAAAGLSADPVPAARGADPALAGASGPTRRSRRVE